MKPEVEQLSEQFRQMGVAPDQALPAWTGLYPAFGGYGNWQFLFSRWRALVWRGGSVELWTRWSGVPSKRLLTVRASQVFLLRRGRTYDRIAVGPRRAWISSRHRDLLLAQRPDIRTQ